MCTPNDDFLTQSMQKINNLQNEITIIKQGIQKYINQTIGFNDANIIITNDEEITIITEETNKQILKNLNNINCNYTIKPVDNQIYITLKITPSQIVMQIHHNRIKPTKKEELKKMDTQTIKTKLENEIDKLCTSIN